MSFASVATDALRLEESLFTANEIPTKHELESYSASELFECIKALNGETPGMALLKLNSIKRNIPKNSDKKWRKINTLKSIETTKLLLAEYEKNIKLSS